MNEILRHFIVARRLLSETAELPKPVLRVMDAISSDPARDWKANELASEAGLSYSRLRLHFRNSVHETLHQYIQHTRLNLARELLGDRSLRIREIAERLHFSNEYYFSTLFRQQTGLTPSQFREHLAR